MVNTDVVIVAAGRGLRAGGDIPKQYLCLAGRYVLARTIESFLDHPAINRLVTVIHPDDKHLYELATADFSGRLMPPVYGGENRQESVKKGLEALEQTCPDLVLIQDGARPFTDKGVVDRVIEALAFNSCVIPVIPLSDTIKLVENGNIVKTVDRNMLFAAQTPQGFNYTTILDLHRRASQVANYQFTDDASLAEWADISVATIDGNIANRKLTTREDLEMAEFVLNQQKSNMKETRTGIGFDVHRFEAGDGVILCGIRIPYEQKLQGHSDADVAMHALTDALFGSIGAGDIGSHFPPNDPQWKGLASEQFLTKAITLVQSAGGRLINVDLTIICERPKIEPYRETMRNNLARILQVPLERISVKATTTEGLGFTGRREGIAAQAIASVEMATGTATG